MAALMRRYSPLWKTCVLLIKPPRVVSINRIPRNIHVILHQQQRLLSLTPRFLQEDSDDDVELDRPIKSPEYKNWKYFFSEEEIQTGLQYMTSEDYTERYGGKPVWAVYKRNFKGQVPKMKTRKMCIRGDKMSSNPCPICRDQNLALHHRNVKLLNQFICPHSGEIYTATATGLCQRQHKRLEQEIEEARYRGLIMVPVPDIEYDYSHYYGQDAEKNKAL